MTGRLTVNQRDTVTDVVSTLVDKNNAGLHLLYTFRGPLFRIFRQYDRFDVKLCIRQWRCQDFEQGGGWRPCSRNEAEIAQIST